MRDNNIGEHVVVTENMEIRPITTTEDTYTAQVVVVEDCEFTHTGILGTLKGAYPVSSQTCEPPDRLESEGYRQIELEPGEGWFVESPEPGWEHSVFKAQQVVINCYGVFALVT